MSLVVFAWAMINYAYNIDSLFTLFYFVIDYYHGEKLTTAPPHIIPNFVK